MAITGWECGVFKEVMAWKEGMSQMFVRTRGEPGMWRRLSSWADVFVAEEVVEDGEDMGEFVDDEVGEDL